MDHEARLKDLSESSHLRKLSSVTAPVLQMLPENLDFSRFLRYGNIL